MLQVDAVISPFP